MIPVPVDFPVLQSESAIVLDLDEQGREVVDGGGADGVRVVETGPRVLYEKNADEELAVASLTKIMTTLLVLEKVKAGEVALSDKVTVNAGMLTGLEGFAVAGLTVGQVWTVEDLLYTTMLPSAGDAAQAVASYAGGSLEGFVAEMNTRASELELKQTKFSNVVGFDEENYSTARDIAKLTVAALENEEFVKIFDAKERYVAPLGKSVKKTLATTAEKNSLEVGMITGAKTGFTYEAGRCLASTAVVKGGSGINGADAETDTGEHLLMVNLGADWQGLGYIEDPAAVYGYLGENYEDKVVAAAGETVWTLPVENSPQGEYEIRLPEEARAYLPKDLGKSAIVPKFTGVEKIADGVKKGEKLGILTLSWHSDGESANGNNSGGEAEQIIYATEVALEEDIYYYNWPLYIGLGLILLMLGCTIVIRIRR